MDHPFRRRSFLTVLLLVWNLLILWSDGFSVHSHGHRSPLSLVKVENIRLPPPEEIQDPRGRTLVQVSPCLINNGDWVTVTFEGVLEPSNSDWIGLYSPSNVDFQKTAPVKYQFANFSNPYYEFNADGAIKFKLVNMHADFKFVLFGNGTDYPIFKQQSSVCTFRNLEEPMQGHLSLTGNPSEMRIGWATGYHTTQTQYVRWGTVTGSYKWTLASTPYSYQKEELCGKPATTHGWRDPGLLHTAVMTRLIPSTKYYYIYGSQETGWSVEYSFVSTPVSHSSQGVTLIAYGDMGKGEEDLSLQHWPFESPSLNTTRRVIEQLDQLDFVMHIGDLSYAVGYGAEWDTFMAQILPVATRVPYMTSPGNHERDFPHSGSFYNGTDSGGECGVPYENRFVMPPPAGNHMLSKLDQLQQLQQKIQSNKISISAAPQDPQPEPPTKMINDTPWYSFEYGNIHFVMMSTEHNFTVGTEQYKWIEQDLASVNRTAIPWIIFTGHRPMYIDSGYNGTQSGADYPVAQQLQDNVEPLLVQYRVPLALWGHHHSYQRTCPLFQQQCQGPNYPVHAVIGMAGFQLSDIKKIPPAWIESLDDVDFGYARISTTTTTLHFQYFNNANQVKDDFTLTLS